LNDSYLTLASPSTGEFRDRGSKFLAYAFPVLSEEDWQLHLEAVKKEHPKARHHCYAYRLGMDQNNFRANDDGEPSGTAGRPILGQIDSFGLTNVIIIVVRYFGGTLLGTSGLINAYKISAQDALQKAEIVERILEDVFRLKFEYPLMSDVMNAVKRLDLPILTQEFYLDCTLEIAIRQGQRDAMLTQLKAHIAKISLEEAETLDAIGGLEIDWVYTR
jgi:uncharacterized YigZ family protein